LLSAGPVAAAGKEHPDQPLPQDTGAAGLKLMLLRLGTTARLLHTTAHPDDEDGGMLSLEARGKGVTTQLLTLNRGEGGQNKVGSNLFDVLGVLRTLELLGSDRYYGVEQRFTRVADFGFSKSPDETFQKWQGHDLALADLVRVIRTFRPDVIASRFQGSERDGHGNHQAAGILSKEAFRAAADPNRFPQQIEEGLLPWQAKKFYTDGFGASADYTLKLDTGTVDPGLGMSYIQYALEGLHHQLSQGAAGWSVDAGPHFTYYKLLDSVLPPATGADGHETNFFDGIDTTLPGLAKRLGSEESNVPFLRDGLTEIEKQVKAAAGESEKDPTRAVPHLLAALGMIDNLAGMVDESGLSSAAKLELLTHLREKQQQCETAVNLALGVSLEATVAPPMGPGTAVPSQQEALTIVSPGEKLLVVARFHNGSKDLLEVQDISLRGPQGWSAEAYRGKDKLLQPGEDFYANFRVQVPVNAEYTRPYWHRADPETESVNRTDAERYATLPFPPPALEVRAKYAVKKEKGVTLRVLGAGKQIGQGADAEGRIAATVAVPFKDENGAQRSRPLAVGPAFSMELEPFSQVIPTGPHSGTTVKVAVSSNLSSSAHGALHLEVPEGWRAEPSEIPVSFSHRGEAQNFEFKLFPASLKEGKLQVRAVLESSGAKYSEGYSVVTREDLGAFYYYQPAVQRLSVVDVQVPKDLAVGYIPGAGDDIPTVLQQIGIHVQVIPPGDLSKTDLSRFATMVIGIRAYDTQKEVAANNQRLLDYVQAGGTLIVQYNTGVGDFDSGHFTPFPAQMSRARVSLEEAPVEILASDDSVFHYPNSITQHDFEGWVQERGLYFMGQWDSNFKPLLASHDPGEPPLKGGMLRAQFGKGTYIYTGYAFFRQLPAGVPGAIRLYVNLLAAGHESKAAQ
jgi:LmbE family N-acetylglucosaminyl deacetylase